MPPREIFTLILPEFNGVLDHYWGQNPLKFHTEYIGFLPLALAPLALGRGPRRRLAAVFAIGAVVFLLFAFGGYSPLYRALFNVLPFLSKIRAMGMVFFLPAFFASMLAGIGLDRILAGAVLARTVVLVCAAFGVFALLGATGALQGLAEALAIPERADAVFANAGELRSGALRLLVFVLLGGLALWFITTKRASARNTAVLVCVLIAGDLWSVDRQFFSYSPRANVLFHDDAVTSYLKKVPQPFRVLDAGMGYGQSAILMSYGIMSALGYHGFELRAYDELGGKTSGWQNLLTPNLLDLMAVRFLILRQPSNVPGYHQVVAPTVTAIGRPAVLYEADSIPQYARIALTPVKVSSADEVAVIANPRFPVDLVALYADTSSVAAAPPTQPFPMSAVRASVTNWLPGRIAIALRGTDDRPSHLIVSENWYPDWHATVDGKPGVVRRADHALLSVDVPSGAKAINLWFDSATYRRAKLVSAAAVSIAVLWIIVAVSYERSQRRIPEPN
jgi:hypothetical protein